MLVNDSGGPSRDAVTRQIALLRGINVGAHKRVSMAELRDLLRTAGYGEVRTHLQSGNVVLTSQQSPTALGQRLNERIRASLGIDVDLVVRTRDELAEVIERDPFGELVDDPKLYQVSFLSAEPAAEVVHDLNAVDVDPERFFVSGREIYAWHPTGIQRSRLAGLLTDRRLGVTATARNWNTVTKLLALASE